jgi:hypothetical protein
LWPKALYSNLDGKTLPQRAQRTQGKNMISFSEFFVQFVAKSTFLNFGCKSIGTKGTKDSKKKKRILLVPFVTFVA